MNSLLAVIDMQNGFVNSSTEHIITPISQLIQVAGLKGLGIVFSRFINSPGSGYVKWIRWSRFMEKPEIDIHSSLAANAHTVFDKNGYTIFTREFEDFVRQQHIGRIFFCGVATDGCVLKSAVDAFERDIEPLIIRDACASHAGTSIHDAGLLLASRFIGKHQLIQVENVLTQGFCPASEYPKPTFPAKSG